MRMFEDRIRNAGEQALLCARSRGSTSRRNVLRRIQTLRLALRLAQPLQFHLTLVAPISGLIGLARYCRGRRHDRHQSHRHTAIRAPERRWGKHYRRIFLNAHGSLYLYRQELSELMRTTTMH